MFYQLRSLDYEHRIIISTGRLEQGYQPSTVSLCTHTIVVYLKQEAFVYTLNCPEIPHVV